jgi:hypothetical protein
MARFDPKTLVEHIDSFGKGLSQWETNFIADLIDNPPARYTEAQIKVIERIYEQKC